MKIILMALVSFVLIACDNQAGAGSSDPTHHLSIISRDGKQHDFKIEIALTPAEQEKGLMNRTEMPKDAGMLFVFAGEEERGFWMKNTLIPLDMIFIKKDGTIHRVHDSAKPNDLTSIKSQGPVFAVLELNGGVAKELGITDGDKVHHLVFGNSKN